MNYKKTRKVICLVAGQRGLDGSEKQEEHDQDLQERIWVQVVAMVAVGKPSDLASAGVNVMITILGNFWPL
jgi:hypothetical protein